MKKIFLILAFITTFCSQSAHARARIPVTYGDHEKIVKVADLPEEYTTEDGVKLDLGYKYTVFEILFVPLWQTGDGKLVGYSEKYPDNYYDFDEILADADTKAELLADAGVTDEASIQKVPFWDAWGGKLIAGVILAIIIAGAIFGRTKKEPVATPASQE